MLNETDSETLLKLADHDIGQLRSVLLGWAAILYLVWYVIFWSFVSVSAQLTVNCYTITQFCASSKSN